MGKPGGGCDVFRGHDSIQGVTDVGRGPETLPGYYGIGESAWQHFSKVWDVPYEWLVSRFKDKKMMEKPGFTVARWYEGVLMDPKEIGQEVNLKAVMFWGHSTNSMSQMDRVKKALEKVELIVDVDPFVTNTAVLPDRKDGIYLLPAATNYEQWNTSTNTNRDLQWRDRVVPPIFEARTDLAIMVDFAERLGFRKEFIHYAKGDWKGVPASAKDVKEFPEETIEDVLREINLSCLSIGYNGQTPERLKRQQQWAHVFDIKTKKAVGGPVDGEQWDERREQEVGADDRPFLDRIGQVVGAPRPRVDVDREPPPRLLPERGVVGERWFQLERHEPVHAVRVGVDRAQHIGRHADVVDR